MTVLKVLKSKLNIFKRRRQDTKVTSSEPEKVGGVFVSTSSLVPTEASMDDSSASRESRGNHWKSSEKSNQDKNVPLAVGDPDSSDEALHLGKIMARSRHLPSTSYFSSNHIMVNKERSNHIIAPLIRMRELDEIAKEHADQMAASGGSFHSSPDSLRDKISLKSHRLGENVAVGDNIRLMHRLMMNNRADRNNILDRRYTHMGMATARGLDGQLYLCQIFHG